MTEIKIEFHVGNNDIEFDNFKEAIEFSKELETTIKEGEEFVNLEVKRLFEKGVKK